MGRNKSSALKAVLGKALRRNRRVPIFVIAKTKRRISRNPLARNWRRSKLKVKIK
ncbi:MAG: 50S ribosomal protein L39e [Candidatus Micrarchaeia archaeon]